MAEEHKSKKVKAIMSNAEPGKDRKHTYTDPLCTHHLQQNKINWPATYEIMGQGDSEVSSKQGRVTGK